MIKPFYMEAHWIFILKINGPQKLFYSKCSILNTFLFLFSTKTLVFRAGIGKMDVRIANRVDPDQTARLLWVCTVCLGCFGLHLPYI